MIEDGVREFSPAEFAERLGLPPGTTVTSIGMIWFDLLSGAANNIVRVRIRPGPAAAVSAVKQAPAPLEDQLRRLAAKWYSQARHPQHQNQPEVRALLEKHADELLRELLTERGRNSEPAR
jgi:hypothetical protein